MNNKLSVSFVLTALLVIWLTSGAPDARAEWELLCGTDDMGYINALETDGTRLYAGTDTGVYISLDDGHTWRSTEVTAQISAIAITDDAVYACAQYDRGGIWRSDDRGETWHSKNIGLQVTNTDTIRTGEIRIPALRQILATNSGMVIAIAHYDGTYISHDRGETWHDPVHDWVRDGEVSMHVAAYVAMAIWSMTEFDGYLWVAFGRYTDILFRSPDNGNTWKILPHEGERYRSLPDYGQVGDWAVVDNRLYVGAEFGFARWNEAELAWDDLSRGLPVRGPRDQSSNLSERKIRALAVNRGRIFAGLDNFGVYMYDKRFEWWVDVSQDRLNLFSVDALVSHKSKLYAAASHSSGTTLAIFRGSFPTVQPYGKSATTWGAIKQK